MCGGADDESECLLCSAVCAALCWALNHMPDRALFVLPDG